MYYLTTRYYDPKTGRFINADSIEYLKPDAINGLNLYAYCKNNPIKYVDPTGHEEMTQDEITDILCGAAIILWAVTIIVLHMALSDSSNSGDSDNGNGNYFDPDLDWKWQPREESLGPGASTEKPLYIEFPATIGQLSLYLDAQKWHSLYVNLLSVSVFAGFDIDKNMYGFFVDVGLFNFGYDGRYLDIETSGIGAALGLGWQNGKLVAKYDPVGYWGIDASVDFGLMIKDLLQ